MANNCEKCGGIMKCFNSRDYDAFGVPGTRRRYRCIDCGQRASSVSFMVFDSGCTSKSLTESAIDHVLKSYISRLTVSEVRALVLTGDKP